MKKKKAVGGGADPLLCQNPARAAYMIAWRDRYIKRLEEELAAREEERGLLTALLYYALSGAAREGSIRIDKRELSLLLGRYRPEVENGEDAYVVRYEGGNIKSK